MELLSCHNRQDQSLMVKPIGSVSLKDAASGSLLLWLPLANPLTQQQALYLLPPPATT